MPACVTPPPTCCSCCRPRSCRPRPAGCRIWNGLTRPAARAAWSARPCCTRISRSGSPVSSRSAPNRPSPSMPGYSRDWLKGREITTVQAASTDCALIPRSRFPRRWRLQPRLRRHRLQGRGFLPEAASRRPCLPVAADGPTDRPRRDTARAGSGILAPDRRPRGPLGLRAEMAASPHHPIAREHRPMTGMEYRRIRTSAFSSSATAIRPSRWAGPRWHPTTCSTASTICPAGRASISPASARRSTATRTAR